MRPDAAVAPVEASRHQPLVEARGLGVRFERRGLAPVVVLDGLDLSLDRGVVLAITGVSGSGKSTLLHVLGGMLRPSAGHHVLDGVDPWKLDAVRRADWRNSQVGFVFQAHRLLAELTALENVLAPTWIAGMDAAEARARAEGLLERLGLADRSTHHPAELSGGEAQRVAVARALVRRPRLVLADEPTGNLDRGTGLRVFEHLVELQRESRFAAIVATHDEQLARRCDGVLHLEGGRLRRVDLE